MVHGTRRKRITALIWIRLSRGIRIMAARVTQWITAGNMALVNKDKIINASQYIRCCKFHRTSIYISNMFTRDGYDLAGRSVSCNPSSLTLFDGHKACLPCPSENGKKLQASQVSQLGYDPAQFSIGFRHAKNYHKAGGVLYCIGLGHVRYTTSLGPHENLNMQEVNISVCIYKM